MLCIYGSRVRCFLLSGGTGLHCINMLYPASSGSSWGTLGLFPAQRSFWHLWMNMDVQVWVWTYVPIFHFISQISSDLAVLQDWRVVLGRICEEKTNKILDHVTRDYLSLSFKKTAKYFPNIYHFAFLSADREFRFSHIFISTWNDQPYEVYSYE